MAQSNGQTPFVNVPPPKSSAVTPMDSVCAAQRTELLPVLDANPKGATVDGVAPVCEPADGYGGWGGEPRPVPAVPVPVAAPVPVPVPVPVAAPAPAPPVLVPMSGVPVPAQDPLRARREMELHIAAAGVSRACSLGLDAVCRVREQLMATTPVPGQTFQVVSDLIRNFGNAMVQCTTVAFYLDLARTHLGSMVEVMIADPDADVHDEYGIASGTVEALTQQHHQLQASIVHACRLRL